MRLYVRYWRRYPWLTAAGLVFSLILALQNTIVPLLVALALGQLIRDHVLNVALIVTAGGLQFLLVLLGYLLDTKWLVILHDKVSKQLYQDGFNYLVYQDYSFFADRFSGSLVTQSTRIAKAYSTFHDTIFFDLLPQVIAALIALSIMTYYSPPIGLAATLLWLLSIAMVVRFALLRLPMRRRAVAKESEQIGELADTITNALTLKTFAAEKREIKRYDHINNVRGDLTLRSWQRAIRNAWIMEAVCALLQIIVFVGGLLAVSHQHLQIATFLLFQVYIIRIIENIRRSSMIVRQLEVVSGDGQEMAELLSQPPLIKDSTNPEPSLISKGFIKFENVKFQYPDASNTNQQLFSNFDMHIKSGEKIGLVGPSGGGKTTITRLLLRFLDIQSGAITIDGQDISNISQQDLRQAIAYVPQEPLLFHRSIKDNIRYGKPDASDEEVAQAASKAYANDFIKRLPDGYDTLVGERGVKLSGGQRQRVAIARAMLVNAPILVLDEATSALDSDSERLIQKGLWELMKGKTAVVIAHRLSTINHMDRIAVLEAGKIIEEGKHAALLKRDGLYAKLWKHQSGGFLEE